MDIHHSHFLLLQKSNFLKVILIIFPLQLSCIFSHHSGMRGISRSLWAENPEQGKLFQPNMPCVTLLRSVALPAKPMWNKKFWHPTPSWRWVFPASLDQCAILDSVLRLGLFVFMKGFNNTDVHILESQTPWAERLRAHWLNMSVLFRALYLPFTAWPSPP